jgi:hypothetical protein
MRFKFHHQHPPNEVEVATGNPPNQPRPFHCGQCREADKRHKIQQWWKTMTVATAIAQGREACAVWFGVREA